MSEIVRSADVIAGEINFIKRQTAVTCLNAAVEIGKLLIEAKESVPYGDWGKWLENNVDYSSSTANNLMKLYSCYGDRKELSAFSENCNDIFGALTPSQALVLASLPEDQRLEYVQTHDVESESVRDMKEEIKKLKKDHEKLIKDKDKEIKKLKSDADSSLNRANDYMKQVESANKRAEEAEKQLSEQSAATVDKETIRKEYADEIEKLKSRIKNAENSNVQKFAVHFDLLQTELQICDSLILEQLDSEMSSKLRAAFLTVIKPYCNE